VEDLLISKEREKIVGTNGWIHDENGLTSKEAK